MSDGAKKTPDENSQLLAKLHELYSDQTKHSVYQNVPLFVRQALNYSETINEQWRGDSTRWEYMCHNLDFDKESILDVGANTGFFTLSIADRHPLSSCTALEGNLNHTRFIEMIVDHFNLKNVNILQQYLDYKAIDSLEKYDTILLYNVLHHAGVDFDTDLVHSKDQLYAYLVRYLGKLGRHCNRIVFQMGFNWGGNKQEPIVMLNDDSGKIVYTCRFLHEAGWTIETIAMPRARAGELPVCHTDLPEAITRAANAGDEATLAAKLPGLLDAKINTFSEFYRRPIFVCRKT